MNLNDYQTKALSFRIKTATPLYALMNLPGEVGELFSLLAKAERDGPKQDICENIKKELGDILWHVSAVAHDFQLTLDDIAAGNIDKLQSRSDRGKLQGSGDSR